MVCGLAYRTVAKPVLSHFVLHDVERFDICLTIECSVELIAALCTIGVTAVGAVNDWI